MRYLAIASALIGIASTAQAQQAPPAFAPWEMDAPKSQELLNLLGEVPLKYALPVFTFLATQERAAVIAQEHARKPPASKPPTPSVTPETTP